MNSELIKDLSDYSEKNDLSEVVFMQNLRFKECIAILVQVRDLILTDENYEMICQADSKVNLDGVAANIEIQIRHHKEVRNIFNHYTSSN